MSSNTNPKTGIAFGVIDARKAMDLWQEIQNDGVNTTLKAAEDDVKDRLRSSFAEFDAEECFKKHGVWEADPNDDGAYEIKNTALIEWLDDCIKYATEFSGEDSRSIAEEAGDVIDKASGTFKIEELVNEVMSMLWEEGYFNGGDSGEDCYDYESGGFTYHLSCLGGAAMIWVFNGPYATYGRTCSPCVPGALDCDNFTDETHGNCVGYCLDPADIDDDEDKPVVLYSVDAEGNMEKLPYTQPVKEEAPIMSQTLTTLAANAMSMAFQRVETIYETLVDQTHAGLLAWGAVDASVEDLRTDRPEDLIEDVRRAAGLKLALSRLIRTRPDVLPPTNLKYESMFASSLIKLGDAVFLDDLAIAVEDLLSTIKDSSWDFNAAKAAMPATEPEDSLGFNSDLGEVSPGPVEPHDEDAAHQ